MQFDRNKVAAAYNKFTKQGIKTQQRLAYMLKELRIVVSKQERKELEKRLDPEGAGSFKEDDFLKQIEKICKGVNAKKEMQKVFRIHDEEGTGVININAFNKIMSIILPKDKPTQFQQRQMMKYGRETARGVDYQQLCHYMIKMTEK